MADMLQIAGLLVKEVSPLVVNLFNQRNGAISIEKTAQIQQEKFGQMRQALQPETVQKRLYPPKQECLTCGTIAGSTLYPEIWKHLHGLPSTLPSSPSADIQDKYAHYIRSIIANLPCEGCSAHGMAYVREHPIDCSSREKLDNFLCLYHNAVRESLGQPITHSCRI